MTAGAEPKKLAILGVLVLVAGFAIYKNFSGDSDTSAPAPAPKTAISAPVNLSPETAVATLSDTRRGGRGSTEIKPSIGPARPEDRRDPASIDPTLRLDLLAKIQSVEPEASMRNVFTYGAAPPPPAPAGPPQKLPAVPQIAVGPKPAQTPPPPPPGPPPPPPVPQAPPITMKYYGYKISKATGQKEAFLLDGDDIIIATENEAVKKGRYKVVSIGLNSITIEDTQFKSTQTVKIQEEAATA